MGGRIERTTLGDIAMYFKEVYEPSQGVFIAIKIDLEHIRKLQLDFSIDDIKESLLHPKNIKGIRLSSNDVIKVNAEKLRVRHPVPKTRSAIYFDLQDLKLALPKA